jgi:diaminobutyrate-2-oxoglutarate transaminase
MFAFEAAGIVPDVLILSKAIGGGQPLSLIVYHERLDGWQPGSHAGTFRGNQLAMHAGLAVIEELLARDLIANAKRLGERFLQRADRLLAHDCVGDVRGRGLMLGVEFVDPAEVDHTGTPVAAPHVARRVQQMCFNKGLICELGGRLDATLRLLPPLIITDEQLDKVQEILLESVCEVVSGGAPSATGTAVATALV